MAPRGVRAKERGPPRGHRGTLGLMRQLDRFVRPAGCRPLVGRARGEARTEAGAHGGQALLELEPALALFGAIVKSLPRRAPRISSSWRNLHGASTHGTPGLKGTTVRSNLGRASCGLILRQDAASAPSSDGLGGYADLGVVAEPPLSGVWLSVPVVCGRYLLTCTNVRAFCGRVNPVM